MIEREYAIERLEFFSKRTNKNLGALEKTRRWPWKRKERLRYLSTCTSRLTKIGVLNLLLGKSEEAKKSFDLALDLTSEFATLVNRFQPSVQEIHTISGAMVVGLGNKALSVSGVLMDSFDIATDNLERKMAPLDSEARKHRIKGIGAFLCWVLGRKDDSLRLGREATFESESNALLTVVHWSKCIVTGLEGRADDFSNQIEMLIEYVNRRLSSGDASFGEECLIYTPAIALIELARQSGIEVDIEDMQRIPRSFWI